MRILLPCRYNCGEAVKDSQQMTHCLQEELKDSSYHIESEASKGCHQ